MATTTYLSLQTRAPSSPRDPELGLDSAAVDGGPRPLEAATRPRQLEAVDTLQRVGKSLRDLGIGAVGGLAFGAASGLVPATIATAAWLGSDMLAGTDELPAEVVAVWRLVYRAEVRVHTLVGAVAGAALPWSRGSFNAEHLAQLAFAFQAGQTAGFGAAIGGALVGSALGNFGAFVFNSSAEPVTGVLRPSLAMLAYCAVVPFCTRWAYQGERNSPGARSTSEAAPDSISPPTQTAQ